MSPASPASSPPAAPAARADGLKIGRDPALLALVLGALILRLSGLVRHYIWFDEAVLLQLAQTMPMGSTHFFSVSPLTTLLLGGWSALFGVSETILRLPFAFIGAVSIVPLYTLAGRFGGRGIARLAALLLAVNPFHLHYSQQVSGYGPCVLLTLLAMNKWLSLQDQRASNDAAVPLRSWLTLGALDLLCMLTTPIGALVPLIQLVAASVHRRARALPLVIVAGGVVAAAVLFSVVHLTQPLTLERYYGWTQALRPERLWLPLQTWALGVFGHGELVDSSWGSAVHTAQIIAAALVGGLVLWGALSPRQREGRGLLVFWVLVPVASLMAVSLLVHSFWVARYFCVALPAVLILAARGVATIAWRSRLVAGLILAAVLAVMGWGLGLHYRTLPPSIRELVQDLQAQRRPGDGVVLSPTQVASTLGYHLDGDMAAWDRRISITGRNQPGSGTFVLTNFYDPTSRREQSPWFRRWLRAHPRVWFAAVEDWPGDAHTANMRRVLARRRELKWTRFYPFSGARLTLFQKSRTH